MSKTPDKSVMRSSSEYVKSPAQQASKYMTQQALKQQTTEQLSAKRFLQQKEAQGLADMFREKIERAVDEEFSEWTVIDCKGDMMRKAFAKIKVDEGEYVHLYALRLSREEPWTCRYAANKCEADEIEQAEDDYESLGEQAERCTQMEGACRPCGMM
mmetsp:Transcript_73846/g.171284  ORF Transcript_73846/g.171284 Transcript_73846/m.171284 type:complete len:157 (+) Transcript_73846:179-649(+)